MKCPNYEAEAWDGRTCAKAEGCNHPNPCYHGWLTFWSPSERAGLKAMGHLVNLCDKYEIGYAIRAFVFVARTVKEQKDAR